APEAPGAIVRWEGGNDFTVWCDTQSGYIAVGSVFMRCWSWCVIGMSLFNMYNSIFQAVGKWKISLLLAVLRLGVIFTVPSLALNALFGVSGLMWVQAITDTLSCLIAMALYQHFKRSLADEFAREDRLAAQTPVTANRIIAISRQFGSGGRTIGKEVAARLGIPCYDSELIDRIAAESGLAKEYVEKYGESAAADSLYGNAVAGRDRDGQSVADKMWLAQKKVIADLAAAEPCVIVGRCTDYILRDVADCMTVFVHASDEKRAERILSVYGEREESPVQRLHDKDKKRRAYYELYTGSDWGAAQNYALCLDGGKIGIDGCVNAITELYKHSA
ncbi:cytidylate kinase family protein, partial [Gemmiger sp. An120]|uniref:cytidylate kinase-like family protein n=1 Tax=Gemmiger sp. An120 TaxID=1965549 RepID=UPI0031BB8816